MPRVQITLHLMSTHLQLMGLSSEPILSPIQQASDFSRLSLSKEYNWNVAQVWNIVSRELTSQEYCFKGVDFVITYSNSFYLLIFSYLNGVSTHRMNKYADNGSPCLVPFSRGCAVTIAHHTAFCIFEYCSDPVNKLRTESK